VVENTFGDLLNRWRRLRFIYANVDRSVKIVVTASCLHNFCIQQNDSSLFEGGEREDTLNQESDIRSDSLSVSGSGDAYSSYSAGRAKRSRLINMLA
jgi:hypothetical protein